MGNKPNARTTTKKNAGASTTGAPAKAKAVGVQQAPDLGKLNGDAATLVGLIRPKFDQFDTPSQKGVTIKKIMIGARDVITAKSTVDGVFDMGLYAMFATFESLVFPVLTLEQINEIDPDDFEVIWSRIQALSFRKVGEVVKSFPVA